MRPIDADVLKNTFQSLAYDDWNQGAGTTWANAYAEAADIVEDQQTIDAELVIRCKDCCYWDEEFMRCSEHSIRDVNGDWEFQWFSASDDYCAWAKRRDDDAT